MIETIQRIVLASRPVGEPTLDNFRSEKVAIPHPGPGQMLLRTLWLSLDPYMRGRMSDAPSYAKPVGIGDPMEGGTVSEVVASNVPQFAKGDIVVGRTIALPSRSTASNIALWSVRHRTRPASSVAVSCAAWMSSRASRQLISPRSIWSWSFCISSEMFMVQRNPSVMPIAFVREPDAGDLLVRFDERDVETESWLNH
jgi:N-terminal domain of oxidoreductase